ncbi:hypothetical protein ACH5RR_014582 [Cinchona calisaya]|uniref:CASP-like protein n=1 Tax=Cinchona calisaya TaxID=153742 RepID=A0ABD3A6N6_9GENT
MDMEFQMTKQNADYTVEVVPSKMDEEGQGGRGGSPKALLITQLTLRILVVALTLAAIIITITAKQTVNVGILSFKARYQYSSATRFQVGANAVVCAFSFMSVLLLPCLSDPGNYYYCFYLLLHDMVMTMLMISGCAAASTVGYLAKNGQKQGGWIALCKYLDKFCDRLELALALAYLAFFCMFVLTVMAACKLKSNY